MNPWRLPVLVATLAAATACAEGPGLGAATSNDLARTQDRLVEDNRVLAERVKKLEAQLESLQEVIGERRGAEGFESMAKDLRDLDRRVDDMERDVRRLADAVQRAGRR